MYDILSNCEELSDIYFVSLNEFYYLLVTYQLLFTKYNKEIL